MAATLTYLPHIKGMIHMMKNVRHEFLLVLEITVYTFLKEKMFWDQDELIQFKQENALMHGPCFLCVYKIKFHTTYCKMSHTS